MFGLINEHTKAIGGEIKCMGKEKLFGQMEEPMLESKRLIIPFIDMKMIKSTVTESLNGATEDNIMANGDKENSTVEGLSKKLMGSSEKENG